MDTGARGKGSPASIATPSEENLANLHPVETRSIGTDSAQRKANNSQSVMILPQVHLRKPCYDLLGPYLTCLSGTLPPRPGPTHKYRSRGYTHCSWQAAHVARHPPGQPRALSRWKFLVVAWEHTGPVESYCCYIMILPPQFHSFILPHHGTQPQHGTHLD